jgi:TonB-linked SusC/RagA family outer membrane protein
MVSTPSYVYGGADLEALKTSDPATYNDLVNPANYDFQTHQIVKYMGDIDWYKEAFRYARTQNYQLQVSGGSEDAVFSLSANYNEQESLTQYGDSKRLSLRTNSMFNIKDRVRVGENIQIQFTNGTNGADASSLYYMLPYMPVKDEWGNWVGTKVPGTKSDMSNPISSASRQDLNRNGAYSIFGNAFLEIDLLKNLTLRTSIGINHNNDFTRNFNRVTYENGMNTTYNSLEYSANKDISWTWTNLATYAKQVNNHLFKLMAGTEAYSYLEEDLKGTTYDFLIDNDINYLVLGQGQNSTALEETDGNWTSNTLASYFGRFDYSFADKYLINATIRYDGSPVFAPENKWGSFPAVGVGWRISEESFMSSLDWVNDLKLRASWGVIGNALGIPRDNQYNTYKLNAGAYPNGSGGYLSSYTPSIIGNTATKWEETNSTNIGFDASLFDHKLEISAEWFNKDTKDLLVQKATPSTGSAADKASVNLGSVQNKGFEALIINRGKITNEWRYEAALTFSSYKNKATSIYESDETIITRNEFFGNYMNATQVGQEISYYYGYQIDGFFETQAEVDAYDVTGSWITPRVGGWRVADLNNDGVINAEDKTYLGSPHPDFITSLNLNTSYKNFDLTAFFYAQVGGEKINLMKWYTDQVSGPYGKSTALLYDSWTEDNPEAKLPVLNSLDNSFTYITDYWVEDVSFLRLKTLQLGYSIPQSALSKIGIGRLRIYVQASNVFTLTNYTNMEPDGSLIGPGISAGPGEPIEVTDLAIGSDRGSAPVPKQVIIGINLDF